MKFDLGNSEFKIIDVLKYKRFQNPKPEECKGRDFSVLSCRLYGYSEITLKDETLRLDNEHYFLCPANVQYKQQYFDEEIIVVHLSFTENPPKYVELIPCPSSELKEKFSQLYTLWLQKQPRYMCKCKSIVYDIFYKLYVAEYDEENSKIKKSMDYLYANYTRPDFNIQRMIERSFLSPAYFRRIFKKQYHCTVVEFITCLRMEYAKSLLGSREYSVKEVGFMCGYADEKYFSTLFYKYTGIKPSNYR